jgi:hypothetical protein
VNSGSAFGEKYREKRYGYVKRWRERNPEQELVHSRRYRERNRTRICERALKQRAERRELRHLFENELGLTLPTDARRRGRLLNELLNKGARELVSYVYE